MGAVLALPLLGSVGGLASAAVSGLVFCCGSSAAAAMCKSCNCNSSIATRIGYSLIFLVNSIVAWLMLTDWAVKVVEGWTYDYLKLDCAEGRCYGVLAVHRINFALALFHFILSLLLIGVHSTRSKRAAIQNGWWGPKVAAWLGLVVLSFLIPNAFFIFYGTWISLVGAAIFILIGLVLLVDFAHTWSETCLEKWEENPESNLWKYILVSSTLGLFALAITLTGILFAYFAGSGCGLNKFFISANLILSVLVTGASVHPAVQDANPRSGLAQAGMVVAYTAYLVTSAVANHDDQTGKCNPLQSRAEGAKSGMVVLGAVFTFLAIAYSTSRAATQSTALVGKRGGSVRLEGEEDALSIPEMGPTSITTQPTAKKDSLRTQALMAAIAAGSLPASALDDEEDSDDEGAPGAAGRDDERAGTKYNYAWFHVIFVLATMYTAMLLTNWNVVTPSTSSGGEGQPMKIGRSHVAMWVRIVSSWLSLGIYGWSLVAPVVWEDRFGGI